MSQRNKDSSRKLVIMGLNNAGKSSIALSLRGQKALTSHLSLGPTKGHNVINTEILNTEFSIIDLGGQKMYRANHLKNLKRYLKDCNKLIYVIDIQDKERFALTLEYLENILTKLITFNSNLRLSIFFHKFDPNIKEKHPQIEKEIQELAGRIQELVPSEVSLKIFKTSIYTIFEKNPVIITLDN